MHGMCSDFKPLIDKTIQNYLLPWQQSYESLKVIMLNNHNFKDLILQSSPTIQTKDLGEEEKEIFIKFLLITSFNRLMKYEQAEKIFQEDTVQNYINGSDFPLLKYPILLSHITTLLSTGDDQRTKKALENCIDYLSQLEKKIKEVPESHNILEIKNDLLSKLELFDKALNSGGQATLFSASQDKLNCADKLLENHKYEEALNIIRPILQEFEDNQNSFNNTSVPRFKIGLECYSLMSMYNRCIGNSEEAITYLDKEEKLLEQYTREATNYWGGHTAFRSAGIHMNRAACYSFWGHIILYDPETGNPKDDMYSIKLAKEKFTKGYEEGCKAETIYSKTEVQKLNCAKTYAVLAISKFYLGSFNSNIEEKNSCVAFSKEFAKKAEILINKLTDQIKTMGACELWIDLAGLYGKIGDDKKIIFCLSQAENNQFWEQCAEFRGVPLKRSVTILQEFPNYTTQDLTWNECYKYITDEKMVNNLGECHQLN